MRPQTYTCDCCISSLFINENLQHVILLSFDTGAHITNYTFCKWKDSEYAYITSEELLYHKTFFSTKALSLVVHNEKINIK